MVLILVTDNLPRVLEGVYNSYVHIRYDPMQTAAKSELRGVSLTSVWHCELIIIKTVLLHGLHIIVPGAGPWTRHIYVQAMRSAKAVVLWSPQLQAEVLTHRNSDFIAVCMFISRYCMYTYAICICVCTI